MSLKKSATNIVKEMRIKQKTHLHEKEANMYLKAFPDYKISKEYKKEIQDYWKQFDVKVSDKWHRFFSASSGIEDPRFIGCSLFYAQIIGRLNFSRLNDAYMDKCKYDYLFPEVKQPETIMKNINGIFLDKSGKYIDEKQVLSLLKEQKCIVKPSVDSGGGTGIEVLEQGMNNYEEKVEKILKQKNFIVQNYIEQHEILGKFNKDTVQTIRVISFLWDGNIYFLSHFLRIGNIGENIVVCETPDAWMDIDGMLQADYHDPDERVGNNKELKMKLSDTQIPNFSEMLKIIEEQHKKIPYFRFIGWDFTIDYKGDPVLLEINLDWPAIITTQCFKGPLFGELTDDVMKWVFSNKQDILDGVYVSFK